MSGAVTTIDTPQTGPDGTNAGGSAGTPGGVAGSATDSGGSFSNQDFSSVSGLLDLEPRATGGLGGGGARGANGANGASQTVGNDTTTQPGLPGIPGGAGGGGGDATILMADDTAGTDASPFASTYYLDAVATGGGGGASNISGNGGSGGENETIDLPGDMATAQGTNGGVGGTAGPSGNGGSADTGINGFTSVVGADTTFIVDAFAGAGGSAGSSLSGGSGGTGGTVSSGGNGSAGGQGGAATASLAGTTATGQYGITATVAADGGAGGNGGAAGAGGSAIDITDTTVQDTDVWTYGPNGNGGAGGAGGAATASFTGNALTSFTVNVNIQANGGDGGTGGAGFTDLSGTISHVTYIPATPGASGAAGAIGTGQISFTNNVLTVGSGIPGDTAYNSGNRLTLQLSIEGFAAPGGSAVAVPLDGAAGGNLAFSGNNLVGNGHSDLDLALNGPGSSVINTANSTISINGSPANTMTGFTSFDLDDGDTFVAGTGAYIVTFAPDPDTLVFLPTSGNVVLNNVTSGNLLLDFSGFGGLDEADVQADTTTSNGNTTIAIPSAGTIELAGFTGAIPTGDETFVTACYATGTCLATASGPVPVEALREGDRVLTLAGRLAEVHWIGHRRTDLARHPRPLDVMPVRVRAHAFADSLPSRDLVLSPDHAVFVAGKLVPIRYLINNVSIAQETHASITYWHVELDRHDLLLAEGLPAESYLDTGNRRAFENAPGATEMTPDFAPAAWARATCLAEGCAPILTDQAHPTLRALHLRLLARAASRKAA
jgi:hypothetical protein